MKKIFITLVAVMMTAGLASAAEKEDSKALTGRVVEAVNGDVQPVQFAYVYCEGTTISAYTNENGEFELPVEKAGRYKLRFSHAGYKVVEKDVKVKKNATKADYQLSKKEVLLTAL